MAGTELQLHKPTVERMRESYSKRGVELNEARLRMATLPAAAEVMPAIHLCTLVMCLSLAKLKAFLHWGPNASNVLQGMTTVAACDAKVCRCLPGRLRCHAMLKRLSFSEDYRACSGLVTWMGRICCRSFTLQICGCRW